jgi:uncharacterized protein YjbI with pentapeptide repeats
MGGSEEPIQRLKALEAEGKISAQEANRLIDAINQLAADSKSQRSARAAASGSQPSRSAAAKTESSDGGSRHSSERHERDDHRHRRHRKRRHQSQGFEWRWDLGDIFQKGDFFQNDQLGSFISDAVSSAVKDMFGVDGRGKFRGIDGRWVNDTNRAQVSHLETPSGEGYTVENNNISAAHIAKLVLENSKFVGNSLQGGRIFDLKLSNSEISHNHLHGASITESELIDSTLKNVKLNGAAFHRLELRESEIEGGEWNGANMKNVVLVGSRLIEIEINGGRFKDVRLDADTVVERLSLVGSSWRRCTLSNTTFQDVRVSRQDISDLVCESSVLTDVRFKSDWQQPAKNLTMCNFQANNVRFRDCKFDNTEFLDCAIDGLTFRGVDFSGMKLTTPSEFQALAKKARENRSTT